MFYTMEYKPHMSAVFKAAEVWYKLKALKKIVNKFYNNIHKHF
jgi:hypothetical protein